LWNMKVLKILRCSLAAVRTLKFKERRYIHDYRDYR
jgi:hypothetical protein